MLMKTTANYKINIIPLKGYEFLRPKTLTNNSKITSEFKLTIFDLSSSISLIFRLILSSAIFL